MTDHKKTMKEFEAAFVAALEHEGRTAALRVLRDARDAGVKLFEAGGHRVIPEPLRAETARLLTDATRRLPMLEALEESAKKLPAGGGEKALAGKTSAELARAGARGALGSVGRAAGMGAAIDGGIALVGSGRKVFRGEMTTGEAAKHVGAEAGKGAAASAASTAAAVGTAALLGPAAPAMLVGFGVGVLVRAAL